MYYKILEPIDKKLIGKYSQLKLNETEDYENDEYSLSSYDWNFKYPDDKIRLPHFNLQEDAKLTNVLSGTFLISGLVIDEITKNIMEKFKLGDSSKFYSTKNHFYEGGDQYYILYIVNEFLDYIDYEESLFYINTLPGQPNQISKVKNKDEFLKLNSELMSKGKFLGLENIIFNITFPKYDLFCSTRSGNQLYVSKALKTALEEMKIIGIEFSKINFHLK